MNLAEKIAALKKEREEKRTAFNKFVSDAKVKAEADDLKGAKELKSKAETSKTEIADLETRLNELEDLAQLNPIAAPDGEQRKLPGDILNQNSQEEQEQRERAEFEKRYKPAFLKMIRGGMGVLSADERSLVSTGHIETEKRVFDGISGLNGADGGYTIPQDISTAINEMVQTLNPLQPFVTTQNTSHRSGSRVVEQRATMTGFTQIGEADPIGNTDKPQLGTVSYSIKDYAGMLPLTNDALADSDANLSQYIARWFSKKSVVTRNSLILAKLQAAAATALSGTDAIKDVLNVTLDPGFMSSVIVNQSAFNFLDKLKDGNGNYLLQPNPLNPTQKLLFGRPVAVVSDNTLPNISGTVAPIFIGDFKEAVILWDRQQQSIATNPYNDSSWNTNTVSMRAIEREDVTAWDTDAFIYGNLTIA